MKGLHNQVVKLQGLENLSCKNSVLCAVTNITYKEVGKS